MRHSLQISIELNSISINERVRVEQKASELSEVESTHDEYELSKVNCAICQEEMEIGQ